MIKYFSLILFSVLISVSYSQEIGKPAPDFSGISVKGDTVKLSDYSNKVLIIDFWASWCKPCREEFPFLIDLYNKYSEKNFSVLAINLDDEISKIDKFTNDIDMKPPFKILFDKSSKIPVLYNVDAMPSSFIIDKKGIVRDINIGFKSSDKEKFIQEIEKYINE